MYAMRRSLGKMPGYKMFNWRNGAASAIQQTVPKAQTNGWPGLQAADKSKDRCGCRMPLWQRFSDKMA
jgi:hypothetical protein